MAAERQDRQTRREPTENQENRAAGEGPALGEGNARAERRALADDSERIESGDYETLERESGAQNRGQGLGFRMGKPRILHPRP